MPVTTEIDTEAGVVIHRTSGKILGADIEAAFVKAITHPDYRADLGRVYATIIRAHGVPCHSDDFLRFQTGDER